VRIDGRTMASNGEVGAKGFGSGTLDVGVGFGRPVTGESTVGRAFGGNVLAENVSPRISDSSKPATAGTSGNPLRWIRYRYRVCLRVSTLHRSYVATRRTNQPGEHVRHPDRRTRMLLQEHVQTPEGEYASAHRRLDPFDILTVAHDMDPSP